MRTRNNKALYESIMRKVSRVVKSALNENADTYAEAIGKFILLNANNIDDIVWIDKFCACVIYRPSFTPFEIDTKKDWMIYIEYDNDFLTKEVTIEYIPRNGWSRTPIEFDELNTKLRLDLYNFVKTHTSFVSK